MTSGDLFYGSYRHMPGLNSVKFSLSFSALIFLLLGNPVHLYPQNRFENLTVKNGLPTNKVYHAMTDSRNFIWFATDNGLCRYDGLRFTVFRNDENDSTSLPGDVIESVFELSYNEILIITSQGTLAVYNYLKGNFENLNKKYPWLKNYNVSGFYKDGKGNFWFTADDGLIKTDRHFNFKREYRLPDKVKGHHLSNRVNLICEDRKGIFWLGMFYRGVVRFNPSEEKFDTKCVASFIPNVQTRGIIASRVSDYVFIATAGEGLYKVNINDFSYRRWKHNGDQKAGLPTDILTSLCFQDENNIWIGSLEGISRLELTKGTIINYSHNPDKPLSLVNNIVEHVICDKQGILWVSTFGGISKYLTLDNRFTLLSVNGSPNSPASNKVTGCYTDEYNNLWAATSKGFDVFGPGLKKKHNYRIPKSFQFHATGEIVRFYKDNGSNLWIGTWGGGISRTKIPRNFKPGDKLKFKNFYYDSLDHHSLSSNFIRSFNEDDSGNLWITTWNGGINIIPANQKDLDDIKFIRMSGGKDSSRSLASNYIHEIQKDGNGNFWLATSKGVQRINYRENKFQMVYAEKGGISNPVNSSTHIVIDDSGNVWNGSFSGLVKIYRNKNAEYTAEIIYKDKFRGIYTMIEDNNGIIWFSTLNSEIGAYNPAGKQLKFYSMQDEVDGCDFYFGFPAINKSGTIFFPSYSGLLYFDPKNLVKNAVIPPVYITGVSVADKEYRSTADITITGEIELDYDFGSIGIKLAALNYIFPEQNEFKYCLEGRENKWISLGNKSEINFPGLSPGKYLLKITGSNNDGIWNNKPVSLAITVKPPYYRNPVFLSVSLFSFSVLVIYLANKKIKSLRKEKQHQLNFSKQLINSQEDERKRLSNELHDSLGQNLLVIKNLLYLYNSSEIKNEDDLAQISELVKESLDEVKEISANLHPHQLEKLGLIKAISAMVKKIEKASGIKIDYSFSEISGLLSPDYEINIYRIIQESLNNIVKHSRASEAKLDIRLDRYTVTITIEDNGAGFDFQDRELQHRFTEGLGLKSMRERARLINSALAFESPASGGAKIVLEVPYNTRT